MTTEDKPAVSPHDKLEDLGLSVRAYKRIAALGGVDTAVNLTHITATDLKDLKGFGAGCLEEVRQVLAARGLN